jgi:hypothetical protein
LLQEFESYQWIRLTGLQVAQEVDYSLVLSHFGEDISRIFGAFVDNEHSELNEVAWLHNMNMQKV